MLLQMFAAKWLDHTPAVPATGGKIVGRFGILTASSAQENLK